MVGTDPAHNVGYISAAINFTNVAAIRIVSWTVISRPHAMFSMLNCDDNTSVRLALKSSVYMIIDISAAIFNGIAVYAEIYCNVFKIRLTSSTLLNGSFFLFLVKAKLFVAFVCIILSSPHFEVRSLTPFSMVAPYLSSQYSEIIVLHAEWVVAIKIL